MRVPLRAGFGEVVRVERGIELSPVKVYGIRTQAGGGTIVSFEVDSGQAEQVAALLLMHQNEIPAKLMVKRYGE